MNYIPCFLIGFVFFCLGYLISDFRHSTGTASEVTVISDAQKTTKSNREQEWEKLFQQNSSVADIQKQLKSQKAYAQEFIAMTSPEQIGHYLDRAFPDYDMSDIQNKRQFALRFLEEWTNAKNNTEDELKGVAYVTLHEGWNGHPEAAPEAVYERQQLYAHFDTLGKFPNTTQVMVRWSNQTTQDVLLFTPQHINGSSQNWVSFTPIEGWRPGHYDVKYYQMNNQMTPIAQTSFHIKEIIH